MMIKKLLLVIALVMALVCIMPTPAVAQIPITSTTLANAVLATDTQFCLASATSVVVPSLTLGQLGSILVVDNENAQVMAQGTTATCFKVKRGIYPSFGGLGVKNVSGTQGLSHGNGQKVWVLGASISTGDPSRPVATSNFLTQRPYQSAQYAATTPTLFGVATTSVTDVNGTFFFGGLEVDFNMLSSGACVLNGATVTTDKHIYYLWDATGTLIANTNLAGVADAGNASIYQCQAWTTPVALVGPAQYFIGIQANGTTDNFQSYNTGSIHANYPTGSQAGTFGVPANISPVPTTFTGAKGPFMLLQQ